MIAVSLKDVVMGGVFGPIDVGTPRAKVYEILGNPDDWSVGDAAKKGRDPWRTSNIWKYGDLEFHFGLLDEDHLALIYADDFIVPRGGTAIALDPWIMHRDATQSEVEHALHAIQIDFRRIQSRFDEGVTGLAIGTRVRLWFERAELATHPVLVALACGDPRLPSAEM